MSLSPLLSSSLLDQWWEHSPRRRQGSSSLLPPSRWDVQSRISHVPEEWTSGAREERSKRLPARCAHFASCFSGVSNFHQKPKRTALDSALEEEVGSWWLSAIDLALPDVYVLKTFLPELA